MLTLILPAALAVPPLPDYLLDAPDGLPTDGALRSSRPASDPTAVVQITGGPGAPFTLVRDEAATEPTDFVPTYQVWDAPPGGWQAGAAYTAQFGLATSAFTVGTVVSEPATATLEIDDVGDWVEQADGTWTREVHLQYALTGDAYSWLVFTGSNGVPRPSVGVFRFGAGASGFGTVQSILVDGTFLNDCLTVYPYTANGDAGAPAEACATDRPPDVPRDTADTDMPDTDEPDEAETRGGTGCGCDGGASITGLFPLALLFLRRR